MITVVEEIHQIWKASQRAKEKLNVELPSVVGKYHTLFTSEKGKISMIELPDYFGDGKTFWEICSSGKFFSDCERFTSWQDCMKRIRGLLE